MNDNKTENAESAFCLRPATAEDVPFISWAVMTAAGIEEPTEEMRKMSRMLCWRTDVLYSWKNSMVMTLGEQLVGSLTCYSGKDYASLRRTTMILIARYSGEDFRNMDMETEPGEFYLDSMAVLPEFRKRGIASKMLKAGITHAAKLNIPTVSLVVSPLKPQAQHLYESVGFRYDRDINIFNQTYRKMTRAAEML